MPFVGSFVIMYATYLESLSDPFSKIDVPCVESSLTVKPRPLTSGTPFTLKNLNSNFVVSDDPLLSETEYNRSSPPAKSTCGVYTCHADTPMDAS